MRFEEFSSLFYLPVYLFILQIFKVFKGWCNQCSSNWGDWLSIPKEEEGCRPPNFVVGWHLLKSNLRTEEIHHWIMISESIHHWIIFSEEIHCWIMSTKEIYHWIMLPSWINSKITSCRIANISWRTDTEMIRVEDPNV